MRKFMKEPKGGDNGGIVRYHIDEALVYYLLITFLQEGGNVVQDVKAGTSRSYIYTERNTEYSRQEQGHRKLPEGLYMLIEKQALQAINRRDKYERRKFSGVVVGYALLR